MIVTLQVLEQLKHDRPWGDKSEYCSPIQDEIVQHELRDKTPDPGSPSEKADEEEYGLHVTASPEPSMSLNHLSQHLSQPEPEGIRVLSRK